MSTGRRSAIAIGVSLVLGSALATPMLACSCEPAPPPPSMMTCDDATMPAGVSRAVPIYTSDRGGAEIVDGDAVPIYFGAQGGMHVQLAVRLEGSGFGSCIAQRTELWSLEGVAIESTAATSG